MMVVSDSTPLISLMKAEQLGVLEGLYGEILIPNAVFSELTSNPRYEAEAEQIRRCAFVRVVAVKERKAVQVLQRISGLDLGESEAIIYADENKADVLLMDEAAGRKTAKMMGLHIQGTVGVLLQAYDSHLLTTEDVEKASRRLRQAHRHISEKLYQFAEQYVRATE